MSRRTPAERTLDAEVRAVEEGHHAFLTDPGGLKFTVKGHEHDALTYNVAVTAVGQIVIFSCDHKAQVRNLPHKVADRTYVPCKHGALVAHSLERRGLLRWVEGRWIPTEKAYATGVATDTRGVEVLALLAPPARVEL